MKSVLLILLLIAGILGAGVAQAADLSGHWAGKYEFTRPDGETVDTPLYMILKHEGNKLTGTAGDNVDNRPQTVTGTIDGNKIELQLSGTRQNKITGTLDEKTIKGTSAIVRPFDNTEVKVNVVLKKIS